MKNVRWLSFAVLLLSVIYFASYSWNVLLKRDDLGPVIEMSEEQIYVSVMDGEEVLLRDVTATDAKDGDVTDSLIVESISGFVDGNERYINYAAFDSDNHVSKISRKMIYTDYEPARFSLNEPLRFPATVSGVRDILGNVGAEDCLDGDVSDRIRFSADSNIEVYTPGEYQVELEVTNSAGDTTSFPVKVTIYNAAEENATPKITLSDYLIYIKKGERLDPESFLESVTWRTQEYALTRGRGTFCVDTTEMSASERVAFLAEHETAPSVSYERFTIVNRVDSQIPGVYEIDYLLEDDNENIGRVSLIVVVEEE